MSNGGHHFNKWDQRAFKLHKISNAKYSLPISKRAGLDFSIPPLLSLKRSENCDFHLLLSPENAHPDNLANENPCRPWDTP